MIIGGRNHESQTVGGSRCPQADGSRGKDQGRHHPHEVKAGDKVIAGKYSGTSVKLDGEEYTIVRQSDILAIVE